MIQPERHPGLSNGDRNQSSSTPRRLFVRGRRVIATSIVAAVATTGLSVPQAQAFSLSDFFRQLTGIVSQEDIPGSSTPGMGGTNPQPGGTNAPIDGATSDNPPTTQLPPNAPLPTRPVSSQSDGRFHYLSQLQGQPNQGIDCGPASVLMALLKNNGRLPVSYTRNNQSSALQELRGGIRGYLMTNHVVDILGKHGVRGQEYWHGNVMRAIDDLKAGKTAIVLTTTGVIANEESMPGFGHYVFVSGYDQATNTFTVNDPVKRERAGYQATEQQLRAILNANAPGNSKWAFTM